MEKAVVSKILFSFRNFQSSLAISTADFRLIVMTILCAHKWEVELQSDHHISWPIREVSNLDQSPFGKKINHSNEREITNSSAFFIYMSTCKIELIVGKWRWIENRSSHDSLDSRVRFVVSLRLVEKYTWKRHILRLRHIQGVKQAKRFHQSVFCIKKKQINVQRQLLMQQLSHLLLVVATVVSTQWELSRIKLKSQFGLSTNQWGKTHHTYGDFEVVEQESYSTSYS